MTTARARVTRRGACGAGVALMRGSRRSCPSEQAPLASALAAGVAEETHRSSMSGAAVGIAPLVGWSRVHDDGEARGARLATAVKRGKIQEEKWRA